MKVITSVIQQFSVFIELRHVFYIRKTKRRFVLFLDLPAISFHLYWILYFRIRSSYSSFDFSFSKGNFLIDSSLTKYRLVIINSKMTLLILYVYFRSMLVIEMLQYILLNFFDKERNENMTKIYIIKFLKFKYILIHVPISM